jgi:hypothetical protein
MEGFLTEFQAALRSGNRDRVLQLTGFPLQVRYAGGTVTYRRAVDVRRDFDRIFTPAVEASLRQTTSGDLRAGQASTVGRVTIGTSCGGNRCGSTPALRLIVITPD